MSSEDLLLLSELEISLTSIGDSFRSASLSGKISFIRLLSTVGVVLLLNGIIFIVGQRVVKRRFTAKKREDI